MRPGTSGRRPRGNGGNRGGRGFRGGRGGVRRYNSADQEGHSVPNGTFHDYPAEFTTLYPVPPDFAMPYVTPAFYPVPFAPPPAAIMEDAQVKSGYVSVDETVIGDMVRKQV